MPTVKDVIHNPNTIFREREFQRSGSDAPSLQVSRMVLARHARNTAASPVSRALCAIRTIASRVGATRSTENVLAKAIHHRTFAHPAAPLWSGDELLSGVSFSPADIDWDPVPDARRTVCRIPGHTDVTVTQRTARRRASIFAALPDPHSGQEFLS
jgi:hypothetical protein